MNGPQTRERRPGGDQAAAVLEANNSILPVPSDVECVPAPYPHLNEALVREAIDDPLACVVVLMDAAGKVSRRTFFTLAAAERAVERARRRGGEASVALVRLQLVAIVGGEG